MKAARIFMNVLCAVFATFTLFGLYRIACELGGFPSPKQMGIQVIYVIFQLAVFAGMFFGIRKLSLKAYKPEKFLLFFTVISFVFLMIVISMGLRVSKQFKTRHTIFTNSATKAT